MLSEAYLRVMRDDFNYQRGGVSIHSAFSEYSLGGDVYHEAGFDALMTGIVWYKMMTYLGRERRFPGVQRILETPIHNTLDKNRVPMASLRTSMNLEQAESRGLATDGKSFVFVLQNVPAHLESDTVTSILTASLKADVKVYRAFNKSHLFFTVFSKQHEEELHAKLAGGFFEI
jgi:hypothetical protein